MTDYLARILEAGSLREELKKADRISTAGEKSVEKQPEAVPPLLTQMRKTEGVLRSKPRNSGVLQPHGAGVFHTLPHIGDGQRELVPLRPFPKPPVRQGGTGEAEAVDLAFRRDSRRYDNGFFLY